MKPGAPADSLVPGEAIPAGMASSTHSERSERHADLGRASHIPTSERIPLLQKIMFSVGGCTELLATGLLVMVWMPYFNIGMGISTTLLGAIMMVFTIWNAILDPILGNISDNARTRWGRRRPFLVVGAVLTGILFPLFWHMPAGFGEAGRIAYLLAVGFVFYICFSSWAMPYYGLQLELTPNYDERTRLTMWMTLFAKLGALGAGWTLAILTGPWFINPATGKGDIVIGMRTACWFIAGGIILFGVLPAIFTKERYYKVEASRQPREPFWQSVRESAGCKPLWGLIAISSFIVFGSTAIMSLSQYVQIYHLFDGDLSAAAILFGWRGSVLTIAGILLIPFWTWLGERFDKRTVVMCMVVFMAFGHLLYFFCLRPEMPYLTLVPAFFESGAFSAIWLFIPSMKADAADYDELHTSRRREGSINSFYSVMLKVAISGATGLGGLVLDLSGFTAKLGHQPPEVLQRMIWVFLLLPIAFWGAALVVAYYYPLSRLHMAEIRERLEARRGKI